MSGRMLLAAMLLGCACAGEPSLRVSPDVGPRRGGTDLRIEGSGFSGHGPVTVHVGNHSAKAVVVESQWLITAKTPQTEDAGPVSVRIEFADGTVLEIPEAFSYDESDATQILTPGRVGG